MKNLPQALFGTIQLKRRCAIALLATTSSLFSPNAAFAQLAILREYGELTSADEKVRFEDDTDSIVRISDMYTFSGEEGQVVRITVQSIAFDTHVLLTTEALTAIAHNDDMPSDNVFATSSQIVTTLPSDGEYTVVVTGQEDVPTGSYVLTVTGIDGNSATSKPPSRWQSRSSDCVVVRCID